MNQTENLYNILEIKKNATQNEIRVAYKSLHCIGSNILLDLFFQNDVGIVFNSWARIVCGVPYSAYFIFS